MSNRFKFRVWNKKESRYDNESYVVVSDGLLYGHNYGLYIVNQESFIIQQYTGVKDKNGKEIYEGDILSYKQHLHNTSIKSDKKDYIVYDNAMFCFKSDFGTQSFGGGMSNAGREEFEVIGNIFENPELLAKKSLD